MKIQKYWAVKLGGFRTLRYWVVFGISLFLIALWLAIPVLANVSPGYSLSRQVIAPASGWLHSPAYQMQGTLGQAPVGLADSGTYQLCSGFRCSGGVYHWLYLPLTKR